MGKDWETFVQVREGQLVTYDRPVEGFSTPAWRKPPSRKGYSGEVTASTQKRIATAVDIFLQRSQTRTVYNPVLGKDTKFRLSFITLTIANPTPIPASEGHKALKSWLQHFKRPWHKRKMSEPMETYLWKAELQKREQLHYHIITNAWLHFAEIRRTWNDLQKARGWTQHYFLQQGHHDPNSTDVHSIFKIRDVKRYLTKYISKQEYTASAANPEAGFPALLEPVRLDAKVWGCSEDLKGAKRFTAKMDKWTWLSIQSGTEGNHAKKYECDHAKFYDIRGKEFTAADFLSTGHRANYEAWLKS